MSRRPPDGKQTYAAYLDCLLKPHIEGEGREITEEMVKLAKSKSDKLRLKVPVTKVQLQSHVNYRKRKKGDPINFRGLSYGPINESGVVFLFGMVFRDLGFLVERIRSPFPDCEAKACTNEQKKLRIEFEFQSRNFKHHGHDAEECDLIVCWEDNWPEAPLEVLELKKVIGELQGSAV